MTHPEEEALGRGYDRRLMRRLLGYLRPYRGQVALAVVVALLEALVQLAGPYLTKEAIDNGIRHRDLEHLGQVALIYLSVLGIGFGLGYLHQQFMQRVGQHVMMDLRMAIFRHLQRLPLSFYDRNPIGRLMTRVTNDVDALNELVSAGVVALFGDLFDVGWKANTRNVKLLERQVLDPRGARRSSRIVLTLSLVLISALVAGVAWLALRASAWIFTLP